MEPESGIIQAFHEQEITFLCKTKVTYKELIYAQSYALTAWDQEGAIDFKKRSKDFRTENQY